MEALALYSQHIQTLCRRTEQILNELGYEGLVIGAGQPHTYFGDDYGAPFKPFGHFSHWCPERSSGHLLHIRSGKKPKLLRFAPHDFWHEHKGLEEAFWQHEFEVVEVSEAAQVWQELGAVKGQAFLGQEGDVARTQGLEVNPAKVGAALDWQRGLKTPYEVACIREANRLAAVGHKLARTLFQDGASELDIHHAYVQALHCCEHELPYHNIVGIDAKSAVLHYQHKRPNRGGSVLLIDAGATYLGYASDITRTYAKPAVPREFQALLAGMEKLQQELCGLVQPEVSYVTLHEQAHRKIAALLLEVGVLQGLSVEAAVAQGLSRAFFPHGLGHMLGIQVHDVGGLQKNALGEPCDRNEKFPTLRMARPLRLHEVITVEPGLYFIPLLLDPLRADASAAAHVNWDLVKRLSPLGGIRVEDDVYLGTEGSRNLTREFLNENCLLS